MTPLSPIPRCAFVGAERGASLGQAAINIIQNSIDGSHETEYSRDLNYVKRLEHEQTLGPAHAQLGMVRTPPQSEVDQIAARLRISREALGMSPAELCRLTKIRPNTYSQWEGAKGRPRLDEAKLLRKYLGFTLDWIYEGDRSGLPLQLATKIAELEAQAAPPPAKRTGKAA